MKVQSSINGKEVLACKTAVDRDMGQCIQEIKRGAGSDPCTGSVRDRQNFPRKSFRRHRYTASVLWDIGSTSVVAYLLDGTNGELLGTKSILLNQRQFEQMVSRCSWRAE